MKTVWLRFTASSLSSLGAVVSRTVVGVSASKRDTNSTASPVPLWLAEGFADYVAFSTADVSVRSAASELIKAVKAGEGPKSLPDAAAFSASSKRLAVAYEGSWLACRMIAEKYGRDELVSFYRKVHTSNPTTGLRDAFKSRLGTTQDRFVADWQRYLQRLADE